MAPRPTRLYQHCGAWLAAGLLSACTLAPPYERPAAPTPAAFPQGGPYPAASAAATPAADIAWRDFFTDPRLQGVIGQALAGNRDLRIAVLNIEEARAQYHVQRASLFPQVDATANATYEHSPFGFGGSAPTGPASPAGGTGSGSGATGGATAPATTSTALGSGTFDIYSLGLGVSSYELDLWGRVRSLTRQALEQYLSTVEAQRASRISLISEVATDWLTLGADRQRLKIARDTEASDEETLRLTEARFKEGIASELDARQAETALDQARSDVATYSAQAAQDLNALNLVVGAPVAEALLPTGQDDNLPTLADLPVGLSSAVLLQRPDVLQAEHTLIGYNANIGAARAAFFPTISLTASGGTTSLGLSQLFRAGSGTWTFSPNLTLPIFDAGRNRANLRYARAEREAAVAQYELAIQTAFREVADALAQRGVVSSLIASQEALVNSSGAALRLSMARYQRGADTYLNALTAQRTLYAAQQTLVAARLTRATNLVTLYRALGGGVR